MDTKGIICSHFRANWQKTGQKGRFAREWIVLLFVLFLLLLLLLLLLLFYC